MSKNLSESNIDRQNILNNPFAIEEIAKQIKVEGIYIDNQLWLTVDQVANFYDVSTRTIRNYLEKYDEELKYNGYQVLTGKALEIAKITYVKETDFLNRIPSLGVFNFRAFLNIGMLLNDSKKAKNLRALILDIVISVMNQKVGLSTKYINRNDPQHKQVLLEHIHYHKQLNQSLKNNVAMGNTKYPYFNDKVYVFLFKERYKEYKALLELKGNERPVDTMYSEILSRISAFEVEFAENIGEAAHTLQRLLTKAETEELFEKLIKKSLWQPLINSGRILMASRDYSLRNIVHPNLKEHIFPLTQEEYKIYLHNKSEDLFIQIEADKEIYKRLKDK